MKNKKIMIMVLSGIAVILLAILFYLFFIRMPDQPDPIYSPTKIEDVDEQATDRILEVTVMAYCPCSKCNKQWAGYVCNGKKMSYYTDQGMNVCAVDPTLISLGSIVNYDGLEYNAVDVGSKIKGNIINILLPTHEEAELFGVKRDQTITVKELE